MRFFDFKCRKCGSVGEVLLPSSQDILPCSCGGLADRVLVGSPVIKGKNKGRYPYFDTQLGVTLESSQHRDRIAKERGLIIMGPDEHRRALANAHDATEPSVDSAGWKDAAEKAWSDIKSGNVPSEITIPTLADVEATTILSEEI